MVLNRNIAWCMCGLVLSASAFAEPRSLLILHTNDIHDHVRKDYDDRGGLAYVAGYLARARSERADAILLDAGDVMEKGDLVAFDTKSVILYEAMREMGYDAGTPGNHDDAYGDAHLVDCAKIANLPLLAVNMLKPDGSLLFPASRIIERNGLKIGVIGVFKPREQLSLDFDKTAAALNAEAQRLEPEADLIIAVVHMGSNDCEALASTAPSVDVFVSGHTHEALLRPMIARASKAIIVQAGCYSEYVGRLDLVVDDETEEILSYAGELVEMNHDVIAPDAEMAAWIVEREREASPHAAERVATLDAPLGFKELAYLGAEGIRRATGTDIGFCHMSQIIRDRLPAGPADVNSIFRTGGQRGSRVVKTTLTGAEIAAYVEFQANDNSGDTNWSGFTGSYVSGEGTTVFKSNLKSEREYSVAMPALEWRTRYLRYLEQIKRTQTRNPEVTDVSYTDAVVALIRAESDTPLPELAAGIERESVKTGR